MKITIDLIKSYNPCKNGIENFEKQYPNYNNTLEHLLSLEDVLYADKTWLATKVVDIKTLQKWSLDCAESVLHNYESVFPNDNRVRRCIEITRKYLLGECSLTEFEESQSAARSAAILAAKTTAWEASWSAASAVSASWSSAEAAAWEASESAESAAMSAARSAESAVSSAKSSARSAESAVSASESAAMSAARSSARSASWSSAEKEQEDINLSLLIALL